MKIVINKCFGGFGLSEVAYEKLIELGVPVRQDYDYDIEEPYIVDSDLTPEAERDPCWNSLRNLSGRYNESGFREQRNHPLLIQAIESIGEGVASGKFADLRIVTVPDGVEWEIAEYDGLEHIAEKHRTWG